MWSYQFLPPPEVPQVLGFVAELRVEVVKNFAQADGLAPQFNG